MRLREGDDIRVESLTDKQRSCDALVQPDGAVTLILLGRV